MIKNVSKNVRMCKNASLQPIFTFLMTQLELRVGRLELRLLRVENLGERFKSEVVKRQQAELFAARLFAVKAEKLKLRF